MYQIKRILNTNYLALTSDTLRSCFLQKGVNS